MASVKTNVIIPIGQLTKMNTLINELKLNINEFIYPDIENGFPVNSGIEIIRNGNRELLIGYRYIADPTYYFMFSQREMNGERFIIFFPNKKDNKTTKQTTSFNSFLSYFIEWLNKVVEHKKCTQINHNFSQKDNKLEQLRVDNYDRMVSFTNNPENSQIPVLPLLYKYMKDIAPTKDNSLSEYIYPLKDLLQSKELYLSNPRQFKDETDCRITFDSFEDMLHFCDNQLTINAKQKIVEKEILHRNNSEEKKTALLYEHLMNELTNIVRVSCLTINHDNLKFWEEYANNNNGYCIEFDFNKSEYNTKKRILPVEYSKDDTMRYNKNNFNRESIFLRKPLDYKVENEYRLVYINEFNNFLKSDIMINTDSIKSITFGYKYTGSIDEIKAIAKENGFNDIKYYQKKLSFNGITTEEV